jgi:hypothetical protein
MSAAHGVNDHQLAIVSNAKGDGADLTIVTALVGTLQDRALEDPDGVLEIDAMLGNVGRVLGGVPFERPSTYRRIVLTLCAAANRSV